MIDRDRFFLRVRGTPFGGVMHQGQVDGCNAILDAWEARALADLRGLAYMLATAKWETNHTMKPIEEIGKGHGCPYGVPTIDGRVFYGRGYVQLTWATNYAKMAALTGADLVGHPELALDPKIAAVILFEGMQGGMFTGVGLPRYFNGVIDDPVNARRIINGIDHADDIAAIHAGFLGGLQP